MSVRADHLCHIRRVEQICTEAADFPTIGQIDEMLGELHTLPKTPRWHSLVELLLDIRLDLPVPEAAP